MAAGVLASMVLSLVGMFPAGASAMMAPDASSVLILGTSVTGGMASAEALEATALGYTPVVVDAATWGAMTTAEFASYRALVLGDPTCSISTTSIAAAEANVAVWSPAITGNVIINGTDPVFHSKTLVTNNSIDFAADEVGKTGLYASLSCYYFTAASGTPVPVLSGLGTFTVVGQGGCPADSHIVAVHPALSGLTDPYLSSWGCSTHEGFVSWPSDFLVLVISKDVPSSFVAPDGTTGAPYMIARGATLSPILCGNGILEGTEECDDGNTTNGDGCSAQCKFEPSPSPSPSPSPTPTLDCSGAAASMSTLWEPSHKWENITVTGVPSATTAISAVHQDEVVKKNPGDKSPDATLVSDGSADLRVERDGALNGRVYHLDYTATDTTTGAMCSGTVTVCVPHDMRPDGTCVDEGPLYDSTLP